MIRYFVIFAIASGVTLAQVSSGSLIGDARDPKQQAISEVVVTARNNATGFTRTSFTGPGGGYRIDKQQRIADEKAEGADKMQTLVDAAVMVVAVIVPALRSQRRHKALHHSPL